MTRIDKELEGIVQSQSFISKQYEKRKTTCENLIKKVTKQLENEISDLNNQLKQVKKQLKSTQRDVTADERQPWTNYENNGNEYLIIGTVVRSEYSNIRYKHLIIGNV